MKDGGLHVPAQDRQRRSTPSQRVEDLPTSLQDCKVTAHRHTSLVHSRINPKGGSTLFTRSFKS